MIKYNNIICSIAKNETPYLKEWVEHHLNIGVQYFVIYDNNSDVPVKQTLAKYIDEGFVEVIDCSIMSLPQVKAYNHCLYQMSEKTQWIAFIDIDEFIILNKHKQMDDLLKEYDSFGGLCLNWELHNASGHVANPLLPVKDAYKEYLPHTSPVSRHIKTILQPRFTTAMCNPHYAIYEGGCYAVNEKYLRVPSAFSIFSNEVAHINHYFTKSFEEWVNKVIRSRADTNGQRKLDEFWDYNPPMLHLKDNVENEFKNVIQSYYAQYKNKNIKSGPSKWIPLISGTRKQEVTDYLNQFGRIVSQHCHKSKDLGLFRGQSGASLYLCNLTKLTSNPMYEDQASDILENIITNIKDILTDHSFANGLCGVGWMIEYLAQNQFIENNTNEILFDMDNLFKESIFNLQNFSLTNGLLSYGMYFLSRITNPENFNVEQKEMVVQIVNQLESFLPDNIQDANEPENLTMLQGYLAVIPFLCKVYNVNIHRYKVLCVLDKYVEFILSFEQQHANLCFPNQTQDGTCMLQWNCGDLAVANALLQAAKISNNRNWENKALEISLQTTSVKEIENQTISIINGTAGLTHLYNRLYQHFQRPELKEAAIFWLDKTLDIFETQKENFTEYGLINGLSGTGLVLIATISKTEPSWDSALLMS